MFRVVCWQKAWTPMNEQERAEDWKTICNNIYTSDATLLQGGASCRSHKLRKMLQREARHILHNLRAMSQVSRLAFWVKSLPSQIFRVHAESLVHAGKLHSNWCANRILWYATAFFNANEWSLQHHMYHGQANCLCPYRILSYNISPLKTEICVQCTILFSNRLLPYNHFSLTQLSLKKVINYMSLCPSDLQFAWTSKQILPTNAQIEAILKQAPYPAACSLWQTAMTLHGPSAKCAAFSKMRTWSHEWDQWNLHESSVT